MEGRVQRREEESEKKRREREESMSRPRLKMKALVETIRWMKTPPEWRMLCKRSAEIEVMDTFQQRHIKEKHLFLFGR